jgi:hypothetical protein
MIKKSYVASLTTTEQTLYEVPFSKKAEWVLLYAVNPSGSTASFDVRMYNAASDAYFQLFDSMSLSSKDFFQIGGTANSFVMLSSNDKVLVSSPSNDDVTLVISVIEYNDIIQGG